MKILICAHGSKFSELNIVIEGSFDSIIILISFNN